MQSNDKVSQKVTNDLISGGNTENFELSTEDIEVPDEGLPETDPLKIELEIKSEPYEVDPLTCVVEK